MGVLASWPVGLLALAVLGCAAATESEDAAATTTATTGATGGGGTGGSPDASSTAATSGTGGGCVNAPGCVCCGDVCVDLDNDPAHCGACETSCPNPPNAVPACVSGACSHGLCAAGWYDCNLLPEDGCESFTSCVCAPGSKIPCYTGPPGTEGVGQCKGGTITCEADGLTVGACLGEVVPMPDVCGAPDLDCDGIVIPADDVDGDGWTCAQGDCCQLPSCAPDPAKVNPGAFEIVGNGLDDDCDPSSSDTVPVPDCGGMVAGDNIKTMDVCQFITGNEPIGPTHKWGVISAELLQADGTAVAPPDIQRGKIGSFGPLLPKKGGSMLALSTGTARAEGGLGWLQPQDGTGPGEIGGFDAGTTSAPPPAYVAPYGGSLPPPASGCQACSGAACTTVHDSINYKVKIRTPTNSSTLHFWYAFFTSEYPERFCAQNDDRFVTLLTSQAPGIPLDTNIALDPLGHAVSVNDGFFPICTPIAAPLSSAPFVPGEDIVLEWIVWDGGDYDNDSTVLLDDFEW